MEMRETAPGKGLHDLHPGWLARHHEQQTQGSGRLQVAVKLEPDHPAACIIVRGHVSDVNTPVVFALARRINVAMPGADIALDLGSASITPEALSQLDRVVEAGMLPAEADPTRQPCRMRIMEPSRHIS